MAEPDQPGQGDLDAVTRQLGRVVRGVVEVAHRCSCGDPDVVRTLPRLPDGTPFPTTADDGVRNMEIVDACYRAAGLEPRPAID